MKQEAARLDAPTLLSSETPLLICASVFALKIPITILRTATARLPAQVVGLPIPKPIELACKPVLTRLYLFTEIPYSDASTLLNVGPIFLATTILGSAVLVQEPCLLEIL